MTDDELRGWKDIANFLQTSERTAQRWESELGLPVHRLGRSRRMVSATPAELRTWRQSATVRNALREFDESGGLDHEPLLDPAIEQDRPPEAAARPALSLVRRSIVVGTIVVVLGAALVVGWVIWARAAAPARRTADGHRLVSLLVRNGQADLVSVSVPDGDRVDVPGAAGRPPVCIVPRIEGDRLRIDVSECAPGVAPKRSDLVVRFWLSPGQEGHLPDPSQLTVRWVRPPDR